MARRVGAASGATLAPLLEEQLGSIRTAAVFVGSGDPFERLFWGITGKRPQTLR